MPGTPSPQDARAALVPTVVDAVRRIVRALRVAAKRTEAETGLSAAQLFVLRRLATAPARSLTELGRRTMTDRSSVAAVVDRLAEGGLIVRRTSGEDRRRATVEITARGRALLRHAPEAPTALLIDALSSLPMAQLEELRDGLVALTEHMGVASHPAGMLFEGEDLEPTSAATPRRAARNVRGRPRGPRRR